VISDGDLRAQLERAMARHGVIRWTVPQLIGGREDVRRIYVRACWNIERRISNLRMLAAARTEGQEIAAVPDPDAIDIWASEPEPIRRQTECLCRCPPCRGTGRTNCPTCGGSGRVTCDACGGRGQIDREDRIVMRGSDSERKTATVKRTEQCLRCRATGKAECDSCDNGKVTCGNCQGSTIVEAWVEVSIERMGQVRVEADFDVEAMHEAIANPKDFDTPVDELPAELLADTGWQSPDAFPDCPAVLRSSLDPRMDRLRAVRAQQFEVRTARVVVSTRLGREQVEFAGRPPQLVSGPIRTLQRRAWLGLATGTAGILFGLGAVVYYLARSPWFAAHGRAELLGATMVLASALLGVFMLGVTLPDLRRSFVRWATPLVGSGLAIAMILEIWQSAEPDVAAALAAIERGELERAEEELAALGDLGRDAEADEVRSELKAARGRAADRDRVARLEAAEAFDEAAEILHEPWFDRALRDEQVAAHVDRARATIDEAWKQSRAETLDEIVPTLVGFDNALVSEANTLAKLLAVRAKIGRGELEAARNELANIAETDATADERSSIETELDQAVAAAAPPPEPIQKTPRTKKRKAR
jgi:hypothetical protein